MSLQCVVPEATPNGSWQLRAIVWASDGGVTVDESTVSDAGGSNDDVGPELTIVTPMPASVSRGESFTVAMRATDPSPPLRALGLRFFEQAGPFSDNDLLECDPPSLTDVSPGVVDVAWVCSVPADLHRGSYWGGYSVVDDFDQGCGE